MTDILALFVAGEYVNKPLNTLKPNEKGIVLKIDGNAAIRQRLMAMGIVKGHEIMMIKAAPMGDPLEFRIGTYNISLRKDAAKNIIVKVKK